MERAVEIFATICFLVIGLSHLLQPLAWVEHFSWLRSKGRAGVFVDGFLCLNFGAFIVAFHNVWTGPGIVLTLIEWAPVAKALIRFAAPQLGLRIYERLTPDRAGYFRIGGVFALAISGFLIYLLLR
jgi:hypothetical protein